ncbi:hypothetical protein DKX38_000945 [Salix brachista]|uniref:NPH3 domain-containing protein n=1 Tax=Salix brachista TaxID=2182728 RepID=A0A5N5P4V9_9ROSI|nr:hypothetical protein DKX38_000945 [Salix brachista]
MGWFLSLCTADSALPWQTKRKVHRLPSLTLGIRLPVEIVLHALHYDQHKLRSGADDQLDAAATRSQLQSDVSPVRENEALRSELMKMKPYISDMQKNQGSSTKGIGAAAPTTTGSRKHTFFSSMSKILGKFNPFKHGSKDTFHIDDNIGVDITKPRRRRFSIS